jgi:hypothetical protein
MKRSWALLMAEDRLRRVMYADERTRWNAAMDVLREMCWDGQWPDTPQFRFVDYSQKDIEIAEG